MNTKKTITLVAAAAVASGGLAIGAAQAVGDGPQGGGESIAARAAENTIRCNGGRNKGLQTRINSTPFIFGELAANGADQQVPGMTVNFRGPRKGTDAFLVTFSAESLLSGQSTLGDWMGVETHLDGVPIEPYTAVGDVYAFTGANTYESNAAQFCVRVGRGKHQLKVYTNLQDGGSNDSLSGWLDDATMSVLRFE